MREDRSWNLINEKGIVIRGGCSKRRGCAACDGILTTAAFAS